MITRWPPLLAFLIVFSLNPLAYAVDASNSRVTRVKLSVLADASIISSVSSYLNRELRALGDVALVDDRPQWELVIIAQEIQYGGATVGVALSTVTRSIPHEEMFPSLFKEEYKDDVKTFSGLSWIVDNQLYVDSSERLQEICRKVIARFDTEQLEEGRKINRKIGDIFKKAK